MEVREIAAAAVNGTKAPRAPLGHPDVLWGLPGQGGLLTEWSESVPDLTWPESVRTYGRMRRDGRLSAILKAFFYPVLRANWVVDPAGARDEAVHLVAADLGLPVLGEKPPKGGYPQAAVPGFSWYEHLRLALLHMVYGFMPFERWFNAAGGRTHLAGVQERQPHTVSMIDIGDDGYVRQVMQNTQDTPLPARNLTWYVNEREGANWAGVSLLRPCYTAWVLKHETMRVHATSMRRWGMGVPNVIAPPGATPAQVTEAQRLAAGMRAGDTAGAGLPNGFEFRLTGISGSVPDAIAFLGYLNQEMTTSALAQIVELAQSAHGSRAVGDSFLDLFLLSLQAVADAVSATVTYGDPAMPGLCRALTEYNWGEGEPVPKVVAKDVGDQHEVSATSLSALVTCGALAPDEGLDTFIRQAWGLPDRVPVNPPPAGMTRPTGPGGKPAPWWEPDVPEPPPGTPPPGGGRAPGGPPGPGPAAPGPAARPGPAAPAARPAAPAPAAPRQAPARQAPGGNMFAPAAAAARPDGLARGMTPAEEAAGLDPEGMRHDLDVAASRVFAQWQPVLTAQRQDLADQVTAAVDDGRLDQLARLSAPTADAAHVLYRGMSGMAQLAAGRMCAEAAAQGVDIPVAAVRIDQGKLRQLAEARAVMAAQYLAAQASRQALQAATVHATAASAGSRAARIVQVVLNGLSVRNLADQLLAALHAAQNMGRIAAAQAGLDMGHDARFTATEIHDANTCGPCAEVDGTVFPTMEAAQEAYPSGGYAGCDGRERCRGTIIADWGPGQVTLTYPEPHVTIGRPQASAAGVAGAGTAFDDLHPRDDHGRFAPKPGGKEDHGRLGVDLYRRVAAQKDPAGRARLAAAARAYAAGDLPAAAKVLRGEGHHDLAGRVDRLHQQETHPPGPAEPSTEHARRAATSLDQAVKTDNITLTIPGSDNPSIPTKRGGQKINYFGNTADTRVVTFADGSRWVRKRGISEKEMHREVAYSRVSDVLGAGAPQVIKRTGPDGQPEIWQPFVPRAETAIEWTMGYDPGHDTAGRPPAGRDPEALYGSPQGQLVGLADKVATGADRHMGNWMVQAGPDGDIPVPIDNSLARFERDGFSDSPFAMRMDTALLAAQHPGADWERWQQGLEDLRGEFTDLGMDEEFRNMVATYSHIRAQAGK